MFNRRQFQRRLFVACFSILPWKAAHTILNGEGLNLIKNEGAFVWLCLVVSDLSCGLKGVSLRSTDSSCCLSGILVTWPRTELTSPVLQSRFWTTWPSEKSPDLGFEFQLLHFSCMSPETLAGSHISELEVPCTDIGLTLLTLQLSVKRTNQCSL